MLRKIERETTKQNIKKRRKMPKPLRQLIDEIDEQGDFDKCYKDDNSHRKQIDMLFELFSTYKNQIAARCIYSGIADLARLGKYDLAVMYVNQFEEKVGYNIL